MATTQQRIDELSQVILVTQNSITQADRAIQAIMDRYNIPVHAQEVIISALELRSEAAIAQWVATEELQSVVLDEAFDFLFGTGH